jgi:hypothetical protein
LVKKTSVRQSSLDEALAYPDSTSDWEEEYSLGVAVVMVTSDADDITSDVEEYNKGLV